MFRNYFREKFIFSGRDLRWLRPWKIWLRSFWLCRRSIWWVVNDVLEEPVAFLKTEVADSSETLVTFYATRWCHSQDDHKLIFDVSYLVRFQSVGHRQARKTFPPLRNFRKHQNWGGKKEIQKILIIKELEHGLWRHLCFNIENYSSSEFVKIFLNVSNASLQANSQSTPWKRKQRTSGAHKPNRRS
jgi:hypothetical protein